MPKPSTRIWEVVAKRDTVYHVIAESEDDAMDVMMDEDDNSIIVDGTTHSIRATPRQSSDPDCHCAVCVKDKEQGP